MPRARKNPEDNWMPPRVRRGKSAYEFRTPEGGTVRLCNADLTKAQVWSAYENFINDAKVRTNFNALCEEFFNSGDFHELATETRKDYRKYGAKVNVVFGKMKPDNIKPEHIRKYMDKRGVKSRVQANREKAFISRVFRWAYERGKVKMNPCQGVKQFKEKARTRYVTDREYDALLSVAHTPVKVAMELAYLCCARQGDILDLKKSQILREGIMIQQSKTAVHQIKAWTERLDKAVRLAESLPLNPGMVSIFLLHQPSGLRYTRDAFNAQWTKAKALAAEKFPELDFKFTFHDLKAKGISDLEGTLNEKQGIAGHKNASQTARYDRKIPIVPVVGGQ